MPDVYNNRLSEAERRSANLPDDYDVKKETGLETWDRSRAIKEAAEGKEITFLIAGHPNYFYIKFSRGSLDGVQEGEIFHPYTEGVDDLCFKEAEEMLKEIRVLQEEKKGK